jgi:hypothetical protein
MNDFCWQSTDHLQSRTDIVEVVEWFQQHQGGLYYSGGIIHGLLLKKSDGVGEYLSPDGRILITRLSREAGGETTQLEMRKGLAKETMAQDHSVGIIFGDDWQELRAPLREGVKFKTGGFWKMVLTWGISETNKNGTDTNHLMAMFISMLPEHDRWFREPASNSPGSPFLDEVTTDSNTVPSNENLKIVTKDAETGRSSDTCAVCGVTSDTIIKETWFCHNVDCDEVGKNHEGNRPSTYNYLATFIDRELTKQQMEQPSPELVLSVNPLPLGETKMAMKGQVKKLFRGWACTSCGLLNARRDPNRLTCPCSHSIESSPPTFPAVWFIDKDEDFPTKNMIKKIQSRSKIPGSMTRGKESTQLRFVLGVLPSGEKLEVVAHYPTRAALDKPGGEVEMFNEAQKLIREEVFGHQRRDIAEGLTRSFNISFGKKYKQVMKSSSELDYPNAPPFVSRVRDHMAAIVKTQTDLPPDFNETMLVEFWETGHMSWHDDGERDMGEVTSSLSWGDDSVVMFGLKPDYDAGFDNEGEPVMDPPYLPGCQKEEERRLLYERFTREEISKDDYERLFADIVRGNKRVDKRNTKVLLEIPTPFGTTYSMVGRKLQDYYLHKVKNNGIFRITWVCRHVGEDHDVENDEGDEEQEKPAAKKDRRAKGMRVEGQTKAVPRKRGRAKDDGVEGQEGPMAKKPTRGKGKKGTKAE